MREVAFDFNKEILLSAMVLPVTKWAKRTCGGLKSLLCVAAFSAEQSATNLKNMYFKKVSKPQNTRGGLGRLSFSFHTLPPGRVRGCERASP